MEEIQFSNMDSWKGGSSGKFGLTFKQIILMHINRCVCYGSIEMYGGYWNESGNNPVTKIYVPNSRETYCNSIKILRACLVGYFDDKMKKADKELKEENDKKLEELKDKKEEWWLYKVQWYIRLFEELIMLSKRLNFFEEESAEENM